MHLQPSPFFEPEDQANQNNLETGRYRSQSRLDTEDYPVEEDEDNERFTREVSARQEDDAPVDYYNDWIMNNLG